jgi:hypothetical protein
MRVTKHQVGKKNKKHVTKKNRKSRNGKIMKGKMMKGGGKPLTKREKENLEFIIIFCLGAIIAGTTGGHIISILTNYFPDVSSSLITIIYTMCKLAFDVFNGTANMISTIPSALISFVTNISIAIDTYCTPTTAAVSSVALTAAVYYEIPKRIADVGRSTLNIDETQSYSVFANKIFGASLRLITYSIINFIDYCKQQTGPSESPVFYEEEEDYEEEEENSSILNLRMGKLEKSLENTLTMWLSKTVSKEEVNATLSTIPVVKELKQSVAAAGGGCIIVNNIVKNSPSDALDILTESELLKNKKIKNLDEFQKYILSEEFKLKVKKIKADQEKIKGVDRASSMTLSQQPLVQEEKLVRYTTMPLPQRAELLTSQTIPLPPPAEVFERRSKPAKVNRNSKYKPEKTIAEKTIAEKTIANFLKKYRTKK